MINFIMATVVTLVTMGNIDYAILAATVSKAMNLETGEVVKWQNNSSGYSGQVKSLSRIQNDCREFLSTIDYGKQHLKTKGVACRDGEYWAIKSYEDQSNE